MNVTCDYEKLLTSSEAAKILNINTKTLNSLARKGVIAHRIYGKRRYFSYGNVSAFVIERLNMPVVRFGGGSQR